MLRFDPQLVREALRCQPCQPVRLGKAEWLEENSIFTSFTFRMLKIFGGANRVRAGHGKPPCLLLRTVLACHLKKMF
jgi:hypothetical protein